MPTGVPDTPEFGLRLVMTGVGITVKLAPAPEYPFTLTVRLKVPAGAEAGTGTAREFSVALLGVAMTPLKFTWMRSCASPRFVPVMVNTVPAAPEPGETLATAGVASTLNSKPLLAALFTFTSTGPEVAPTGTGTVI